jgi:rubrerythrin
MNIFKFIEQFDANNISPEQYLEKTARRDVFHKLGEFGKKLALGAIPLGAIMATSPANKAFATHEGTANILNFALLLEYLESEFYQMGLDSGVIPGGDDERIFMQISKHENQHVEFLKSAINTLRQEPIEMPEFDFTANGAFDPFNDYQQFMALSQAFEDTGVRAYKGQAPYIPNKAFLTPALQIHAVEARHAARIRRMRGEKGWITEDDRGSLPMATNRVYIKEDNVMQGGVDVTTVTSVGRDGVTEAFDEPHNRSEVRIIASMFLA